MRLALRGSLTPKPRLPSLLELFKIQSKDRRFDRLASRKTGVPFCFVVIGVPSMCDYSLELVASRPAKVGDKLVSSSFPHTITRGFVVGG